MQQLKNSSLKSWDEKEKQSRTFGQVVADGISEASGSWPFFFIHVIWFFLWIYLHVEPYPYGLLTMIVSLEAIFLSTFILISQNRQSKRDHIQATQDYETNLQAKQEIETIIKRLDTIEIEKLDKIITILEKQEK